MTEAIQPVEEAEVVATAEAAASEISYEQFGVAYIRRILHKDRILRMVNEVLGEQIVLGPIGAGPGRSFARVSVVGTFRETKGEEIPGDVLTYRVYLPISVVFDLDMKVDSHRYNADVVLPLTLAVHTEAPLVIRIDISVPPEDEIALTLQTPTRRGTMLQKLAGLEAELRRFMVKVVRTELAKPYVQRATRLDMEQLVDGSWHELAAQFLPRGPEDRLA
ncbi:MAG TPA: hypothetical protein VNS55_01405 [Nocardioides sp.]|nr:hypothetical protein [Nocardioides sp.]